MSRSQVSEAIKKREEAWKADLNDWRRNKEAEELAKLNEKERAEREFQKQREAFEVERVSLNERN